jgi:hypothetical protein
MEKIKDKEVRHWYMQQTIEKVGQGIYCLML